MSTRRTTIALSCVVLFGMAYLAASWGMRVVGSFGSTSSTPPEQQSPVEVQFVHNLAPVIADDTPSLKIDLPFVNRTSRIIRVKEVKHCCGVAAASVTAKELQPGQETALRLEINVYGRNGKQVFNSSVHSDAGDVWAYRIHTTVYDRFCFDPPDGVRFGSVDPNARVSGKANLLIYARPGEAFPDALQFRPSSEYTTVTAGEPADSTLENGIVYRKTPLTVRLNAPATGGVTNSALTVTARKGQGALEETKMSVVWGVKRLYDLSPERVFFRKADLEAGPCERAVSVRRSDGSPFSILGVKAAHPAISLSAGQAGKAAEHHLTITVNPARLSDATWDEVEVTTDHPVQPMLRIPVAAFAPQAKK